MFDRSGVIHAQKNNLSEDDLLERLLDYDIHDIKLEDDTFIITCNPKALESVKHAVDKLGLKISEAELEWVPKTPLQLAGDAEEKALDFLNAIEELEDVQNIFTNLD